MTTANGKGWARGYRHESLTCANCGKPHGEHYPQLRPPYGPDACPAGDTTFKPVTHPAGPRVDSAD